MTLSVNFKCYLKFLILAILKRKIFDRNQEFCKTGNKKSKTKRKSYNKITTNFHGKVLKFRSQVHFFLSNCD